VVPPADIEARALDMTCKSSYPPAADVSYDLWDLGEFEQKGARGTKWGTKEDLKKAIDTASDNGIITYIDAVLNHK
jgi:glycosidase